MESGTLKTRTTIRENVAVTERERDHLVSRSYVCSVFSRVEGFSRKDWFVGGDNSQVKETRKKKIVLTFPGQERYGEERCERGEVCERIERRVERPTGKNQKKRLRRRRGKEGQEGKYT